MIAATMISSPNCFIVKLYLPNLIECDRLLFLDATLRTQSVFALI